MRITGISICNMIPERRTVITMSDCPNQFIAGIEKTDIIMCRIFAGII